MRIMVVERWVLSLSLEAGCERGDRHFRCHPRRDSLRHGIGVVGAEQGSAIVYKRGQRTFKLCEGLVQLCAAVREGLVGRHG